jgi:hypothetical protein
VLAFVSQAELQALLDRVEPFTGSFPRMAQADRGKHFLLQTSMK